MYGLLGRKYENAFRKTPLSEGLKMRDFRGVEKQKRLYRYF
jgi:hypothetical protein